MIFKKINEESVNVKAAEATLHQRLDELIAKGVHNIRLYFKDTDLSQEAEDYLLSKFDNVSSQVSKNRQYRSFQFWNDDEPSVTNKTKSVDTILDTKNDDTNKESSNVDYTWSYTPLTDEKDLNELKQSAKQDVDKYVAGNKSKRIIDFVKQTYARIDSAKTEKEIYGYRDGAISQIAQMLQQITFDKNTELTYKLQDATDDWTKTYYKVQVSDEATAELYKDILSDKDRYKTVNIISQQDKNGDEHIYVTCKNPVHRESNNKSRATKESIPEILIDKDTSKKFYDSIDALENTKSVQNLKTMANAFTNLLKKCWQQKDLMYDSNATYRKIYGELFDKSDDDENDYSTQLSNSEKLLKLSSDDSLIITERIINIINDILSSFYDFVDDYNFNIGGSTEFTTESLLLSYKGVLNESFEGTYIGLIQYGDDEKANIKVSSDSYENAEKYLEQYIRIRSLEDDEWSNAEIIEISMEREYAI